MKSIMFAAIGALALAAVSGAWADERAVAGARKSVKELQEDFRKLEFGMFIHYNMATYEGVQWVSGYPDPSTFDPGGRIDTDAWAEAALSAGMTYGVLTAKHVGGFCLWDSKHTTYDVMHPECPYKEDLVAQFVKSFKSRGLKVGLYYCWRHPGFDKGKNKGKFKVLPPECDPAPHSLEEQIEFQKNQIAELVEKYPDVFYIWNDALDDQIMPAAEARAFVRSLGPGILASSNWWDWGKKGTPYVDIAVKELRHFPETNTAPGETCWKLEQKWFWNEGFRSGSAKGVMSHMATAHARNSNFLLNVGPNRNGKIIESSIKTLAEIGKLWKPEVTREDPK
ncbi:MAG: alpha-L-fucosidase [Planctomycetes bacterium]|nr:alpha-L-fucosidase [Planctomycetota bacterium]MBL7037025.1 alpha-L-fucosidase [Pirellulaceae bacterium]